jgi:hypothetical protein
MYFIFLATFSSDKVPPPIEQPALQSGLIAITLPKVVGNIPSAQKEL